MLAREKHCPQIGIYFSYIPGLPEKMQNLIWKVTSMFSYYYILLETRLIQSFDAACFSVVVIWISLSVLTFLLNAYYVFLFFFQTLFSLGASLVDCLSFFTFLRFGTAALVTGFFVCHYVYILELVGRSYRTMGAKVMDFYWVTGAAVMALLAYLIPNWRKLLLVASFPPALFLFLWR